MKPFIPVTLVGVDRVTPEETKRSLDFSSRWAEFLDIKLVKEDEKLPDSLRSTYERFNVFHLWSCFDTTHCLFQEWDAAVVNPSAWDPNWLQYDYIGAPWPYPFEDIGYPPCQAHNCIGNGGFSLRSKRLCLELSKMDEGQKMISDVWICRSARPRLEGLGIQFAPYHVAARFSCENQFLTGQFGLHGKRTIAMNGLDWSLR